MQNYLDQYIGDRLAVRVFLTSNDRQPELRQHEWPHIHIGSKPYNFNMYKCVDPGQQVWIHMLWQAAGGETPFHHTTAPSQWLMVQDPKKRTDFLPSSFTQWYYYTNADVVDVRALSKGCFMLRIYQHEALSTYIREYGYILYHPNVKLIDASKQGHRFLQNHWSKVRTLQGVQWLGPVLKKDTEERKLSFIQKLKLKQYKLVKPGSSGMKLTWKGRFLLQLRADGEKKKQMHQVKKNTTNHV
jgi:hypothetical protein